jgi:ribosomal protein S18 acetylase RimI-like enzyme
VKLLLQWDKLIKKPSIKALGIFIEQLSRTEFSATPFLRQLPLRSNIHTLNATRLRSPGHCATEFLGDEDKTMNRIMRADIADAAEILELQKLAYQSEAVLYNDWSIPPLIQTLPEIKKEFDGKVFLKVCAPVRLIGSVRASIHDGTCNIGRLIVHPEFQCKGIGTRLMSAIETEFPHVGRFELFTGSRSECNIRLYERLGYRIFRTDRLSPQVELVFMEKLRQ